MADYASIAARDPFYNNPSFDPNNDSTNRFTSIGQTVQYVLAAPEDGPTNTQGSIAIQQTTMAGQDASDSYSVGFSVDAKLKGVILQELKSSNTTTWTNQWSNTQTNQVGQTAAYSIYSPVATDNYSGPVAFEVWQDNVYGTFAFVAPGTAPTSPGSITITPSPIGVGTAAVGNSSVATVTLTNNSNMPMFMGNPSAFPFGSQSTARSPVVAFSNAAFTIASGTDTCTGTVVQPNGRCTLGIQFTATASQLSGSGPTVVSGTAYFTGATDAVVLATAPISATVVAQKTTPSLSMSCTPNPVQEYVNPTCTATVSNGATGTVTFLFNGQSYATSTIQGATASSSFQNLYSPANYSVGVSYSGDGANNAATASTALTISPPAALTLSCDPQGRRGSPNLYICEAYVSGASNPTGTVTFGYLEGSTSGRLKVQTFSAQGSSVAIEQSGIVVPGPSGTAAQITAVYSGDSNNAPANASQSITLQ